MAWLPVTGDPDGADAFHAKLSGGYRELAVTIAAAEPDEARRLAERNVERTTDRLVDLHYALSDTAS